VSGPLTESYRGRRHERDVQWAYARDGYVCLLRRLGQTKPPCPAHGATSEDACRVSPCGRPPNRSLSWGEGRGEEFYIERRERPAP